MKFLALSNKEHLFVPNWPRNSNFKMYIMTVMNAWNQLYVFYFISILLLCFIKKNHGQSERPWNTVPNPKGQARRFGTWDLEPSGYETLLLNHSTVFFFFNRITRVIWNMKIIYIYIYALVEIENIKHGFIYTKGLRPFPDQHPHIVSLPLQNKWIHPIAIHFFDHMTR